MAEPARKQFDSRYLVLSNLEPGSRYTLMIFALNDVSPLSDLKQYEVVEFKTEDSDNAGITGLRVDAETESGVTIAWDALSGVSDYEVRQTKRIKTSSDALDGEVGAEHDREERPH